MAEGWTITEAVAEFERAGLPVDPKQLRMVIRALPGFKAIGETPSGGRGGRGHPLYDIGALQRLHSALAPWLTTPGDDDGRTAIRDRPRTA